MVKIIVSRPFFNRLAKLKDGAGHFYMQNGIVNGRVSYTFLGLELIVTDSLEVGDAIGQIPCVFGNIEAGYAVMIKKALPKTDFVEAPKDFFLLNKLIYNVLIKELGKFGATHLVGIDKFSLISIANTFDLLNESEKIIAQDGMQQRLETREGAIKTIPNPMIQQRNTLLNTLNTQLKNLQLDPSSRRELIEVVSNDISNIRLNEEDENLINLLLTGVN
ncbi:TPA: phage major capsid protein [Bacillus toyonensis]|nr:phage major capsid protein [Bacillus toyonensis]